jgi:hypothetical protein
MLSADADYAHIVSLLRKQQLAPYVAYLKSDHATGMAHVQSDGRVVVRISDGSIVSGESSGIEAGDYHNHSNPVTHPSFDPACYRATSESSATYNDIPAIKFELSPVCRDPDSNDKDGDDYPFTTLFANPQDLRPIAVSGSFRPSDPHADVTVKLDQRYDVFDGRVLPSRLKVDVDGGGWMFWLHIHVTETYHDYQFLKSPTPVLVHVCSVGDDVEGADVAFRRCPEPRVVEVVGVQHWVRQRYVFAALLVAA